MKKKFVFDKKTGTMRPEDEMGRVTGNMPRQANNDGNVTANVTPQFNNYRANDEAVAKLEAYANELGLDGILLFRQQADYTVFQIVDERTRKTYAYIGGYALNIKFNMEELNTVAKVEQCLDGIKKLFRTFIVEQAIESK